MSTKEFTVIAFDNRMPLRFKRPINSIRLGDGGAYSGIGFHDFEWVAVDDGKHVHMWTDHSSGCEYNNKTDRTTTYIGRVSTKEIIEKVAQIKSLSFRQKGMVLESFEDAELFKIPKAE